ncbi:hypothetical protein GCM10010123_39710 [Pilimelia anulata]|uniref:Uncharacterized protein n=1 Tax=Pilimelia anulata TaxID=53371 RepID=A0A8J3BAX1_9ACTN|nr:hypothetical protein [Pilimelia anulata]GGK05815.1 hypothetical protein GCM10010123_39710 [Pilimelia anulata]
MTQETIATPVPAAAPPPWPERRPAALALAALALAWLAGTLISARATVSGQTGAVALAATAFSLPGIVAAGILAGAAVALLALRAADPPAVRPAAARCALALTAGLLVAGAAGGAVVAAAGGDPHRTLVAATLAAAAVVGGGLAWPRLPRALAAGVLAALAVCAAGLLLGLAKEPIRGLLGGGDDPAGRVAAEGRFAVLSAVLCGLVAGAVAFAWLGRRGGRWPRYLVAGAAPGLVLLVGEALTRVGGAKLIALTRGLSDADATLQGWLDGSRLNNALVVLFVGAITALILFGRTLPRTVPPPPD